MGRSPCCEQDADVKKGPWTPEEDKLLVEYIGKNGHGSWRRLPKLAGLNRCGKSCRLRWTNYLRPDIKRGGFSDDEERLIIHLHATLGNKWSSIATKLKGRTDNEIKNYWNTHLRKKLLSQGIDPVTHRPRTDLLAGLPNLLAAANLGGAAHQLPLDLNAIKLQADAAKFQILQGLLRQQQLAGVDLSRLGQYNGNYDNLPPLTNDSCTQQTQPAMSSMSPDSLLNRISSGISGDMLGSPELCHGGDGLSSPELGQGGPSASNMTTSPMAPPPPMVAADDHQCNTNTPSGGGDGMSCEQTPASSTFDGLNLDDIDMEGCWAMTDILLAE
ncbi:hypothetical protein OsI_21346 [Oryza sativa Indica Group]|uniref:Uncharacterized protein n=1 Tax=Oryza sativa subsp. indica TaxID=39946 RepID=B8B1K4_ORYSI|nr:hypothetical protein OsI_21346 [Oryza sativa Indica Group]